MSDMEQIAAEDAERLNTEQADDQSGGRDYEFEARALGWKPPEDFKGDPSKRVDAKTFVEKSAGKVPLLEADNRKLLSRLAEMDKRFIKHAKAMDEYEKRGYEKAMSEISAKQREAAEVGDVAAFDALEVERKKLDAKPKDDKPDLDREEKFAAWSVDNPWFGSNDALTKYASVQGNKIMEETGKSMLDDDDLEEISERVKTRFGDKFPDLFGIKKPDEKDSAPPRRSAVGGVTPARGKSPASAADLDARAKQVGESMVRMGIYKDLNEYAKELGA